MRACVQYKAQWVHEVKVKLFIIMAQCMTNQLLFSFFFSYLDNSSFEQSNSYYSAIHALLFQHSILS